MRQELNLWVIGGDMRQAKLAELLNEDGHTVHTFALERGVEQDGIWAETSLQEAQLADGVILPLPVEGEPLCLNAPLAEKRYGLEEIFEALQSEQLLFGGRLSGAVRTLSEARGLTIRDYFAREELTVLNAVPTAEGALQIAMEELPITIHGSKVLVIGYGRVGKITAQRFAALGAKVSVAARKFSDLAWAESAGYGVEQTGSLVPWLCAYDLVVNTVPARVLNRRELEGLKAGALVIDLASKPGGVDFDAAAELGVRCIWALSLPGKVAPVSAGQAIKNTIYNMLSELGV